MSVLRRTFGPSKKEIWRQLSEHINGRFVEGRAFRADKVQASHGEWTVTLDTYAVSAGKTVIVYTRIRAPYVNPDGFRFTIYRRGLFSSLGKLLGMQDVEVGHQAFDEEFIIKGTDDGRLRQLFANEKLRGLISGQKEVHFSVQDDEGWFGPSFPEGADELRFLVPGVIKDVARLTQLYELFAETLDELCRIGSAYQSDPGVNL